MRSPLGDHTGEEKLLLPDSSGRCDLPSTLAIHKLARLESVIISFERRT